jgi:hypothetical protein
VLETLGGEYNESVLPGDMTSWQRGVRQIAVMVSSLQGTGTEGALGSTSDKSTTSLPQVQAKVDPKIANCVKNRTSVSQIHIDAEHSPSLPMSTGPPM